MIGTTVGGYQITRELARGGMGVVWQAKHAVLGRGAVVKLLHPELASDPQLTQRFINEARAAATINDPGIVQVFDVGQLADGSPYIVMEQLEGHTLRHRIRQQAAEPLTPAVLQRTVQILRLLARTLDAAHRLGIVHRDLKPDNIYLIADRDVVGGERTKILDFGIAKLADSPSAQLTLAGAVFGTPAYMAPEQCSDARQVDGRADLYAVGCIAYEMLCGAPPFDGEGVTVMLAQQCDPPVPVDAREPATPPALAVVVMRLLEKQPADRYASAAELFAALESVSLEGGAPPGPRAARSEVAATTPPTVGAHSVEERPSRREEPATAVARPRALGAARETSAAPALASSSPPAEEPDDLATPARARRWPYAIVALIAAGALALVIARRGRSSDEAPGAGSGTGLAMTAPAPDAAVALAPADAPLALDAAPVVEVVATPARPVRTPKPAPRRRLLTPPPVVKGPVVQALEAGPIWNNDDAKGKCPPLCKPPSRWNGGWRTTIPGEMSTCDCETP